MALVIYAKPGSLPGAMMRCKWLRKPPVVGQMFYARKHINPPVNTKGWHHPNCHSHPWQRWRVWEIRGDIFFLEKP